MADAICSRQRDADNAKGIADLEAEWSHILLS